MDRIIASVLLAAMFAPVVATGGEAPGFASFLHIGFDDTPMAVAASDAPLAVTGGENLTYGEGRVGKAADLRESGCVEYRGLPQFNLASGAIELWVKSVHEASELEDHYYLQFLKDDGSAGIEVKFYHVECSVQVTMWAGGRKYRRYGWGWNKDAWQHIVVSWDSTDPELSGLNLYKDGVESGYPAPYVPIEMPDFLRVGRQSPEQGRFAKAWIDEIVVYNRSLTPSQVQTLFQNGNNPLDEKLAAIRQHIARDEALDRERHELLFNRRKIGMLHGRHQSLVNWPDERFVPLRLPVPDKIHETELVKTDLSRYAALFVAGGGGLRLDDANAQALREYVRSGGGYVGICGGAVSAAQAELIDAERYSFGVRGPVWCALKEHPLTESYDTKRKLLFPHASGPLFVVKDGSGEVPVVIFDVGNPPLPTFVNVIAKQFGKGRVVAFSGHPEGSPQTQRMLRNAILWATRITGTEAPSAGDSE